MKRNLIIIAMIAISAKSASAQMASFGVTAGAVFSNMSLSSEGESQSLDTKAGLTFGVMSNIPLGKSFSFQPALNYAQKGCSVTEEGEEKTTIKLNYLELPLNFVYNSPEKNGHFFVGAGPFIAYGIAAKAKFGDIEVNGHFGSGEDDAAKPVEIGLNALLGYQFGAGFNIAANYCRGLNNISVETEGLKHHNYYFGLRIGYVIGGKRL
jgi:hypothetical protein